MNDNGWPVGLQAQTFLRRELTHEITYAKFTASAVREWLCERLAEANDMAALHDIAREAALRGAVSWRVVESMRDEGCRLDEQHGYSSAR